MPWRGLTVQHDGATEVGGAGHLLNGDRSPINKRVCAGTIRLLLPPVSGYWGGTLSNLRAPGELLNLSGCALSVLPLWYRDKHRREEMRRGDEKERDEKKMYGREESHCVRQEARWRSVYIYIKAGLAAVFTLYIHWKKFLKRGNAQLLSSFPRSHLSLSRPIKCPLVWATLTPHTLSVSVPIRDKDHQLISQSPSRHTFNVLLRRAKLTHCLSDHFIQSLHWARGDELYAHIMFREIYLWVDDGYSDEGRSSRERGSRLRACWWRRRRSRRSTVGVLDRLIRKKDAKKQQLSNPECCEPRKHSPAFITY